MKTLKNALWMLGYIIVLIALTYWIIALGAWALST